MKIYTSALFAICYALIGATASAQAPPATPAPPPLPPGPLIQKRAPDFAKWVITTVHAPASSANSASASTDDASANGPQNAGNAQKVESEVTITKTGKTLLREVRDQTGRTWTTWCTPGLQTTLSPDGKSWMMQSRAANADPAAFTSNYEDYSQTDFLGFDWIALDKYTGIKEFGGKKCIVFQQTIKGDTGPGLTMSAYIDFGTRLPVDLIVGGETRNYTFKAPPTAELVLPPFVVQLLKNRQKELDSVTPRSQMH